jgi:hypothetical protein
MLAHNYSNLSSKNAQKSEQAGEIVHPMDNQGLRKAFKGFGFSTKKEAEMTLESRFRKLRKTLLQPKESTASTGDRWLLAGEIHCASFHF